MLNNSVQTTYTSTLWVDLTQGWFRRGDTLPVGKCIPPPHTPYGEGVNPLNQWYLKKANNCQML